MPISSHSASCLAISQAFAAEMDQIELAGSSPVIERLRMQVQRIAPHFRSVLLSGEAGTGKESVARALHAMGRPSVGVDSPLVVCHAADLEHILAGCMAVEGMDATGGRGNELVRRTLFLDRLSDVCLEIQDRMLRALDGHGRAQGEFRASWEIDVRIIASTTEDLKAMASAGRFRPELYRRLATVEIAIPRLRERMEDLRVVADGFVRRFASRCGRDVPEIADEAMARMRLYHWPGNLCELESVLQTAVFACKVPRIEARHLPTLAEPSNPSPSTRRGGSVRLQDVVERHVLQVLKDCSGNKLRAAEMLGISRSTLYRMLDAGTASVNWQ
jgi:DNA-binding NtrC family response regulator